MSTVTPRSAERIEGEPPWTWPREVLEFARQRKVEQYLEPLLAMTCRLFSDRRWLHVYVEQDPELADLKNIVFTVGVQPLPKEEYLRRTREWGLEWQAICAYPRDPVFNLDLNPSDQWTKPHF